MTVLFADLAGFTPLSELLDAEEIRDIQDAYFDSMREAIERYGGIVEKYAGDAVLAIFGVPAAHEDDAERAITCALDMHRALVPVSQGVQDRWGIQLRLRIGVNTGEVVSGLREVGGRVDYAVTGDVVNTAARFQAAAEPGGTVVGEETMHLARRSVHFGEEQELSLKGKSRPVAAYAVLGRRDQVMERWQMAPERTPLVGRDWEVQMLLDAWNRAREGNGQFISLVAEAGVGKSRLLNEALDRIDIPEPGRLLRGRCLSYAQGASLWLLGDLLHSLFRIQPQDDTATVRERIAESLDLVLGEQDDQTRAMAADVLGEVLGLKAEASIVAQSEARIRRQVLIRTLRLLLSSGSSRGPLLITLEDLHWIDEASAEVLVEVLPGIRELPIMLVAAHRPDWQAPWQEWQWTQTLHLQPLADRLVPVMARAVLNGVEIAPELEHHLIQRSDGNPFFVEELLQSLREQGSLRERNGQIELVPGAEKELPATLTEVLLARLDRLHDQARSIAQTGSVIGRRFGVRLLSRVSVQREPALHSFLKELEEAALVAPRRRGADLEYTFKHATVQEVAYRTLLLRRRQQLHAAVARALADLYPGDDSVEVIAYHFARTQEWEEAAHWLERAGDRAAAVYANETALNDYGEARVRWERGKAGASNLAVLDEKRAIVLGRMGRFEEALELARRAAGSYRQAGDNDAAGRIIALMGRWQIMRGAGPEALALIEPALAAMAADRPLPALASLHATLARIYLGTGRYVEGLEAAERAVHAARAADDRAVWAEAEMMRGTLLLVAGQAQRSREALEEAIPLAESVGDPETLGRVLGNLGQAYRNLGELPRSREYIQRAIDVFDRIGDPGVGNWTNLGTVLLPLGQWEEALRCADRAAEIMESMGASWYAPWPALLRGQVFLLQGDQGAARSELERAIALAEPNGDLLALGDAHRALAELEIAGGEAPAALARLDMLVKRGQDQNPEALGLYALAFLTLAQNDAATQAIRQALAAVEARNDRLHLPDILRVQSMLLQSQGDVADARDTLEEGAALARGMSYPYAEARIYYQRGALERSTDDPVTARIWFEQALALFELLGARAGVTKAREALQEIATFPIV